MHSACVPEKFLAVLLIAPLQSDGYSGGPYFQGHIPCLYRVSTEHQYIKAAVESSSLGVGEGTRTLGSI